VARLHRRARTCLAAATAALWTSDRQGFGGARVLDRTARVVMSSEGR